MMSDQHLLFILRSITSLWVLGLIELEERLEIVKDVWVVRVGQADASESTWRRITAQRYEEILEGVGKKRIEE